jgi:hypothetical protein
MGVCWGWWHKLGWAECEHGILWGWFVMEMVLWRIDGEKEIISYLFGNCERIMRVDELSMCDIFNMLFRKLFYR